MKINNISTHNPDRKIHWTKILCYSLGQYDNVEVEGVVWFSWDVVSKRQNWQKTGHYPSTDKLTIYYYSQVHHNAFNDNPVSEWFWQKLIVHCGKCLHLYAFGIALLIHVLHKRLEERCSWEWMGMDRNATSWQPCTRAVRFRFT